MIHIPFRIFLLLFSFSLLMSCSNECQDESADYFVSVSTKVSVEKNYKVRLSYGSSYSVRATGCSKDLEDLRVNVVNSVIKIFSKSDNNPAEEVTVSIRMPQFTAVTLTDESTIAINNFNDTIERIFDVSGSSICSFNGNASRIQVAASDNAEITCAGFIVKADVELLSDAVYNAQNTLANSITNINAAGASRGYVYALDTLNATASGTSRIYYKGNPAYKNITESGSGKVLPL